MAEELSVLGALNLKQEAGGVAFAGDLDLMYRAALESGLASALRVRLGRFGATRFEHIVRGVAALPWRPWLDASHGISIRVTARKSRLYHSTAIAERVVVGLGQALGRSIRVEPNAVWQVVVRLLRDDCSVSLDVTGEPLYRRGYRQATGKAPLRPDLARALLVVAGWDPTTALVDPFCGAGTICIEAAALACRLPPGRLRRFAFMDAPEFDERRWKTVVEAAAAAARPAPNVIVGSDRDAGAVAAARDNAARAGVDVRWLQAPLGRSAPFLEPPSESGLWASNPPYGRRIGDASALRSLYQSIGQRRRQLPPQWRLALVVSSLALVRATGIPMRSLVMTDHGGTKVRLMVEDSGGPE